MLKLFEIGLSGWLIFVLTILVGGGIFIRYISRRKSKQSNIHAGGDVAGGDIHKNSKCGGGSPKQSSKIDSTQTNIVAGGDVAGGNIKKGNK